MTDPDFDLVQQARSGDKAAFGQLVKRYYEMVHAVSYGVLHDHESARDAAQETFIKAFRDIENFEGQSKFKTWLYRISFNTAIDLVRRRRPMESIDEMAEEDEGKVPVLLPDKGPGPLDFAVRAELKVKLKEALEKLSPEHRAVIVLREWEELDYKEIAEILEIQVGTVMSRLFYARKRLAEILAPQLKKELK